ncbi:DUF2207 domain-containing protein [Cytobacillus horneckiae]|uniref:DUF2207 domain-containing protein n=1 Tax=Cytobacillus horneckiae TaxID=549687 RepID=UPI00399FF35A
MASGRIKGITVEIGGDTVGLQNALRDVNKRTKEVQSELKDVERLLKFDPNNVELLAQKQELLTRSIQETTTKLNQLKQAESQVQAQFQRGDISQEQYRGFRRELQQTEQQLQGYQQSLQDMQTEQQQVEQRTRQMAAMFEATGTSVEGYANVIGQRLVRAIQNGTASSRDLEYAFQRIGREAIGSNGDLERLRRSLSSIDDGNSIQNIRRDMQQLREETNQAEEAVGGLGDALQTAAGAAVAGGGIAGAVQQSLDLASLDTKIDISFNVPEESKESVKEAVRGVVAYGIEQEEALEGVRRQWALNKEASDEVNAAVIDGAKTIATAYAGIDFTELVQETNEIGSALGISNQEALGLVDSLLEAGFPPEQLDIIAEYGEQLKMAGYDAETIQNIFAAGVDTKSWNIDNLLDGLKEGRIGLAEFGLEIPKALSDVLEKTKISEDQVKKWGKAVAAGGEEGKNAMFEVAKALSEVKDETVRNEIGVQLYGTMWEDQGSKIIDTLVNAEKGTADLGKGVENLGEKTEAIDETPMVELSKAMGEMKVALAPILTLIAELVTKLATWVSENPKVAAAITGIVSAIGILAGALVALYPVFGIVQKIFPYLLKILPYVGRALTALSGPIGWIITLITILAVAIYKNWDEIWAKTKEIFGGIKDWIIETWESVKTGTSEAWEGIKTWLSEAWESIKEGVSIAWTAIKDFFVTWWDELLAVFTGPIGILIYTIVHNWEAIKIKTSEIWNGIKQFFVGLWESIKSIFNSVITSVVNFVKEKWENLKNNTTFIFNGVKSFISTVWNGIKDFFSTTIGKIVSTVRTKFQEVVGAIESKMETAQGVVEDIVDKIKGFFDIDLYDSGKAIIQSAIDGIMSMKDTIYKKVEQVVGGVRDYWPFSPAKRGPLSDIDKMDFAGPIGDSIEKARSPLEREMEHLASRVNNSMQGMTAVDKNNSAANVPATSNQVTNVFNNEGLLKGAIFQVREEADIEKIAIALDRLTKQKARNTGVIIG